MDAHDLHQLISRQPAGQHTYTEFIRAETLSVGLAIWPAGSVDDQQPHTEDEVYYVAAGRGSITVGDEHQPAGPGSVVFVPTGIEHHFHDIQEDLHVVVFWAPPRHSRRPGQG